MGSTLISGTQFWQYGLQSVRTAMRIASSPTLRIAYGSRLAALLSIVGYQVFRRWISHVRARRWSELARYCAATVPGNILPIADQEQNIETGPTVEAHCARQIRYFASKDFCIPSPSCVFGFERGFRVPVRLVDEQLSFTHPMTVLA